MDIRYINIIKSNSLCLYVTADVLIRIHSSHITQYELKVSEFYFQRRSLLLTKYEVTGMSNFEIEEFTTIPPIC